MTNDELNAHLGTLITGASRGMLEAVAKLPSEHFDMESRNHAIIAALVEMLMRMFVNGGYGKPQILDIMSTCYDVATVKPGESVH